MCYEKILLMGENEKNSLEFISTFFPLKIIFQVIRIFFHKLIEICFEIDGRSLNTFHFKKIQVPIIFSKYNPA